MGCQVYWAEYSRHLLLCLPVAILSKPFVINFCYSRKGSDEGRCKGLYSEVYGSLAQAEKDRLVKLASTSEEITMSPKETVKAGSKAFKIIHRQVLLLVS